MARSIHDTWGVMQRAKQADWSDPEVGRAIRDEARANWRRQRILRNAERLRRKGHLGPPPPVDVETLPILTDDTAPYAYYPATEEDIRAILHRLPKGSMDGLQAIRMQIDHTEPGSDEVRDPFTHRRRHQVIPGVYSSNVLGYYDRTSATIALHPYLCDPGAVGPFMPYFKVCALKTLVHEAAHHFDDTFRIRRSRWDLGDEEKQEGWAERGEDVLGREIVGPYVLERYPAECAALGSWVEEHGGAIPRSLAYLIAECDSRLSRAFLTLVSWVLTGEERDATRVAFARQLHLTADNEAAEKIADRVLQDRPDDPGALAVKACIAQCAGRQFDIAESLCLRAITLDPESAYAREVLVRGYAIQGSPDRALKACEEALSVIPSGDMKYGEYILCTLVESHLLLGAFDQVGSDIARMRAWGSRTMELHANVYQVIERCWAEHWEEALLLATRLMKKPSHDRRWLWLAAARFECAHRLHQPHLAGDFNQRALSALKKRPFTAKWAERIAEHLRLESP